MNENPRAPAGGESIEYLRFVVAQAQEALQAGFYFPALLVALTLPDICGAASSTNGWATPTKYVQWIVRWVEDDEYFAETVYDFRCSLLHQGGTPQGTFFSHERHYRLAFIEPGKNQVDSVHGIGLSGFGPELDEETRRRLEPNAILFFDVRQFIDDIAAGVDAWIAAEGHTTQVQQNMEKHVQRFPEGVVVEFPFIT